MRTIHLRECAFSIFPIISICLTQKEALRVLSHHIISFESWLLIKTFLYENIFYFTLFIKKSEFSLVTSHIIDIKFSKKTNCALLDKSPLHHKLEQQGNW